MRRCPLLNETRRESRAFLTIPEISPRSSGLIYAEENFQRGYFGGRKVSPRHVLKSWVQSSYFFSCRLKLRDSRRLVKLDSYANRVHDWLEEEGREGRMDEGRKGDKTRTDLGDRIYSKVSFSVSRNPSWIDLRSQTIFV